LNVVAGIFLTTERPQIKLQRRSGRGFQSTVATRWRWRSRPTSKGRANCIRRELQSLDDYGLTSGLSL
jgi:hypothetical protein